MAFKIFSLIGEINLGQDIGILGRSIEHGVVVGIEDLESLIKRIGHKIVSVVELDDDGAEKSDVDTTELFPAPTPQQPQSTANTSPGSLPAPTDPTDPNLGTGENPTQVAVPNTEPPPAPNENQQTITKSTTESTTTENKTTTTDPAGNQTTTIESTSQGQTTENKESPDFAFSQEPNPPNDKSDNA